MEKTITNVWLSTWVKRCRGEPRVVSVYSLVSPIVLSVLGLVGLIVAYEARRRRDHQAAHQSLAWLEQLRSEAADDAAHLRAHIGWIGDELANWTVDRQTRRLAVRCAALAETKPDPESVKLQRLLARRGIDVGGLER